MKKYIFVVLVLLCPLLLIVSCNSKSKDKQILEAMEKEVAVINAQCPIHDGTLVLTGCDVLPDMSFRYNYTMLDPSIAADTAAIAAENKKRMLEIIGNNPEMVAYKKAGVSFVYEFKDKDGKYIYSFRITSDDYN